MGDEVLPSALATQPDVALLDIEMPGGAGLSVARALREAGLIDCERRGL